MRIGVVLSGCGVFDGSEVYESVITLLALDRADVEACCFAPDVPQMHVVNHLTGEVAEGESRNVLVESARMCRGQIAGVATASPETLDALLIPGGFGAAKNLSDFAVAGADCTVQPDVLRIVLSMLDAKKPVGAICIAPAMVAAILRGTSRSGRVTIGLGVGENAEAAAAIEAMGTEHLSCPVDEYREDTELGLITTPAYMEAGRISEAAAGIEKLVARVIALARN